jgi:hypothetical protein
MPKYAYSHVAFLSPMGDSSHSTAQPGFPRIEEPAPDFEARTTHGIRKLTDYAGKRLVLFSHPADFSPV